MMAGLLLGIILPAAVNNQSTVARIEHPWGVVDAIRQFATSANASESTRRGFLLNLLNEDVTYLKRYARAGDVEGVIASEPGDAGNRLTDAIRRPTGDMAAEEQGLARTGPAQQPLSQSTMTFILIGSGLFAVGCIVVSTVMIFRVMTANAIARRAMAAAAESQEMLDMINVAALMVLRDFDGTIHFWSEGCRRLYGWTAAQAVGRLSHELLQTVYPGSRGEVEAALRRHGTWQGELRQRTTDGAEVTVAACKNLHDFADGTGTVIVTNVTDLTLLRRAEYALRNSEAQFSSLVDTAADGFVIADSEGQIQSVNRAVLRMFGYERAEELVGHNLGVLMPAAEAMQLNRYIAAHRAGAAPRAIGVPGRESLAVRRDGAEFPIDLSVSSFSSNGSHRLTGIIRDATARKQDEMTLRENEARLRLVQQVSGIAYSDQQVSEPEILISEEFARLYGLPIEQTHITADEWGALLHPDDRDRILADGRSIIETDGIVAAEFRICRLDGSVRWVKMRVETFRGSDGQPLRRIGAQQDITDTVIARETLAIRQQELERRVIERTTALAEAEARFRGIFNSQFQLISLLAPDGTILEMNRTGLDAGGLKRADVVGQPIWEVKWWPVAEHDRLRQDIAQTVKHGGMIRRELEIYNADGQIIHLDLSLKSVHDQASGAITSILVEGRDLTEQHHLAAQLAQAQKVQALGQLAGGIAHDFNNILQAVLGAAHLIEQRPDDRAKTRRLARTVISAAHRGTSIAQRLLSFTRRGELRAEAIDTAEMLDSVREVLAHTLGTTITVCIDVPPDIPPLVADLAQLETAIINLGTNARDAMPAGGTLTLAAEVAHVPGDGRHPARLAPGDYVRLRVTDNGTGMDAATFIRAGEPFFTTKPPGLGTGLGLTMVKGFAEQSGGALSISSSPGAGTTVVIWLPQALGGVVAACASDIGMETGIGMSGRILLVDDDDLVRDVLSAELETEGFTTLMAASGGEALALIEAGEAVDAMVSDMSMPGLNGVTTIQRARALRPRLPCFLLTGYVGERNALSAENSFTLVRKPVAGRTLATQIEAALEGARR